MRVKIRISRERDEEINFKFLLERFKICFDCEEGNAWLEEKERKNY